MLPVAPTMLFYHLKYFLHFFFHQISYTDILGPEGRRMKRHLAINCMQDMVICWWSATSDGAWPWSPISCERDRANLLLLGCAHGKLEVKC